MKIEVRKRTGKHTKEIWSFTLIDASLVFTGWRSLIWLTHIGHWDAVQIWERHAPEYDERFLKEEPKVSLSVQADALAELMSKVRIRTWDEHRKLLPTH